MNRARPERPVPSEGGRESMKQQHVDYQVVPYPKLRRFYGGHVSFSPTHAHDPWLDRSRCDQGAGVPAGP